MTSSTVGGDEPGIHFPRWGEGSGGKTALPIWDKFMTRVYQHTETGYMKGRFREFDTGMTFECDKYQPDSILQMDN